MVLSPASGMSYGGYTYTTWYRTYMTDETMAIRDVRDNLGQRVDVAHFNDEATVITKNGQPRAVIVSYEQYRTLTSRHGEDSS